MNHPTRSKIYYAVQSLRGFSNELDVHAFSSQRERDDWVARHADDGDVNSASMGARAITAKTAAAILHDKGDAATQTYNSMVAHGAAARNCPLGRYAEVNGKLN